MRENVLDSNLLLALRSTINTTKSMCEQEERWKNEREKIKKTKIEIIFLIHAFKFSSSDVVQSISWKSSLLYSAALFVDYLKGK